MENLFWYLKEVWRLRKRKAMYERHCMQYRSVKQVLGLDKNVIMPSCYEFDRQRKLSGVASEKEAFLKALIIEINRYNELQRAEVNGVNEKIKWSDLKKATSNLKLLSFQVEVQVRMNHHSWQGVSSNDIENFSEVNLINF